jgi:hypothetical protein
MRKIFNNVRASFWNVVHASACRLPLCARKQVVDEPIVNLNRQLMRLLSQKANETSHRLCNSILQRGFECVA